MDHSQSRRRTSRYRLPAIIGFFVIVACCELAGAVAQARRFMPPQQAFQKTTVADRESCSVEIYAYLKVRGLAQELGQDGDILDFALDDLRAGLVDCLNADKPSGESELFDHADPLGESVPLTVTNGRARTEPASTPHGSGQGA